MRILLDTNVILDLLVVRQPWEREAFIIKGIAYFGDAEVWVPAKSFTDIFYIMRRSFKPERVQELFLELRDVFHLCSLDEEDIFAACERCWPDFEDCLVALCAEKVKADYIVTRDKEGFADASVPALTPHDFIETLGADVGVFYDLVNLGSFTV